MSADSDLMKVFNFTEKDLAANHQGHLTDRQRNHLQRKQLEIVIGYGIVIAVFGGLLFYFVSDAARNPSQGNKLLFALLFMIALFAILAFTIFKWNQYQQDIIGKKVLKTEGKASLGVMETRNLRYKLQVNDLELEIPRRAYKVLSTGKKYRVYYTPKSRTILAIETPK
jgi:hypothetical protein